MGLFSPSKSELADRIDDLEHKLDRAKADAMDAQGTADDARRRAKEAHEKSQAAAKMATSFNEFLLDTDNVDTIDDKQAVVEELDEPRIAWKATQNHVVKLLLPSGATVVHPDLVGDKKRTDEALVLSFHDEQCTGLRMEAGEVQAAAEDDSRYARNFTYEVGERVTPVDPLDTSIDTSCTDGIHVFPTEQSACEWL